MSTFDGAFPIYLIKDALVFSGVCGTGTASSPPTDTVVAFTAGAAKAKVSAAAAAILPLPPHFFYLHYWGVMGYVSN